MSYHLLSTLTGMVWVERLIIACGEVRIFIRLSTDLLQHESRYNWAWNDGITYGH